MQINEKVFVVTGAGNGMGREVALGLARRGATVVAVDLDEAGLAETARLASSCDGAVSTQTLDVTDREAVTALPARLLETHGQIDGVVNIAGIIHRFVQFTDLRDEELHRIVDVNLWGTVNMCRAFLPILLTRPAANITNMSSLAALVPFVGQSFYGASKGAVKQFSEALYAELLDSNVRVVTVFPGNISTNLSANSGVKMLDAGGRKVRSTSPAKAGDAIVKGIVADKFRVVIGADAIALQALARLNARVAASLVARQIKSVL